MLTSPLPLPCIQAATAESELDSLRQMLLALKQQLKSSTASLKESEELNEILTRSVKEKDDRYKALSRHLSF